MAGEYGDRGTGGSRYGGDERYEDPYGLYRRWFESWEGVRKGKLGASVDADEIEELWRHWFRETARGFRKVSPPFGGDPAESLGPLWDRMARSMREETVSHGGLPEDPVEFFVRWYEATHEEWAEVAEELLGGDEFTRSSASFRGDAARLYRELKKASEEGLRRLQVPSRSDLAGVARLVVGVENKIDRMEEAFGEFVYGGSEPATAGSIRALEARMDRLESKMDRILGAIERGED